MRIIFDTTCNYVNEEFLCNIIDLREYYTQYKLDTYFHVFDEHEDKNFPKYMDYYYEFMKDEGEHLDSIVGYNLSFTELFQIIQKYITSR